MEFHHPPNFPWILAAIPGSQNPHGFHTFYRGFLFIWFWRFCWLGFPSGSPVLSSTNSDTGTGEDVTVRSHLPFLEPEFRSTVGEEGEDEEDEEE